ncbi:hypothetical protein HNQ09_001693 [Deinococcus budaensis]|uniref:Uncharacterized protein n=1 Tax=Deinococcus budaensis TaxID=1665626 RepID=A0A7W8GEU2_9DEIO|nr:hypothetical protein [Deinococcus budaensis]
MAVALTSTGPVTLRPTARLAAPVTEKVSR